MGTTMGATAPGRVSGDVRNSAFTSETTSEKHSLLRLFLAPCRDRSEIRIWRQFVTHLPRRS